MRRPSRLSRQLRFCFYVASVLAASHLSPSLALGMSDDVQPRRAGTRVDGRSGSDSGSTGLPGVVNDAKAFHAFAAASVELSDAHVGRSHLLTVLRSVRDIDLGRRRNYLYTFPLLPVVVGGSQQQDIIAIPPTELGASILARIPSPSGDKVAIFREDDTRSDSAAATATNNNNNKAPRSQVVLEVWSHGGTALLRRIKLPNQWHGKLVFDATGFGKPCWNRDETALVYLAERSPPRATDFFTDELLDNALLHSDDGEAINRLASRGTKSTLGLGKTEKWGEKYSQHSALLDLFCVHVGSGTVGKVRNCPGADDTANTQGSYTLGQPTFSPDGLSIVYTAWDAGGGTEMPRRLGLIHCQQRPSQIFASSVEQLLERLASESKLPPNNLSQQQDDTPYICLTPNSRIARSPRFAPPDEKGVSKLVFLCSDKGFDTHAGCLGLHAIDWKEGKAHLNSRCSLVKEVWSPTESSASSGSVMGMLFPGLFLLSLSDATFLSSEYILTTTQWGSSSRMVRISLQTGDLRVINTGEVGHYSESLLCASLEGGVVYQTSAPNRIPALWHVPASALIESTSLVDSDKKALPGLLPIAATKFSNVPHQPLLDFTCDIQLLSGDELPGNINEREFPGVPMHTILLLPNIARHPSPPLIVIPHGGPHSVSSTNYIPSLAYLCSYGGYALALVNYRGSTGFGQGLIQSLPTRIGRLDVDDVVAATRKIQQSGLVDPDRVGVCGGSHGGFLIGHCSGQFADLFRVAAMRNPVVNIPSMTTATDIPDWCFVEALGTYDFQDYRPPTPDEKQIMWEKSPIRYIQNVKAPTLVALGLKDLRVPPSQGLEWFYTLRAHDVPTKLLLYDDDDHAIGSPQAEADHWINIKRWFDEHL